MNGAWARFIVSIGFLSLFAPAILQAQKDDLENDIKNTPKELGSAFSAEPPAAGTNAPLAKPRTLDPAGTYTNQFSGVQFPKRVSEFIRENVLIYDTEARNVGGAYQRKARNMLVNAISVFSYPTPKKFEGRGTAAVFEDEKAKVITFKPNARLLREEPYRAANGAIGDFAEYEMNVSGKGGSAMLRTRLYLFENQGWLLKVLAFYPANRAREAAAEVENFLRSFGTAPVRQ